MAARTLRFVLGDQLSRTISSLVDLDVDRDTVLMAEVAAETTYVPHHPKKIAFLLSAMRHFAEALRAEGVSVDYVRLDDPSNSGTFCGELARAASRHRPDHVVVTEPGEHRVEQMMLGWGDMIGCPVEIRPDTRFVASRADFSGWAKGRKSLRLEHFYRDMRKRHQILMTEDGQPVGGQWNFDSSNRKSLPVGSFPPAPFRVTPDATTQEVLDLVHDRFADQHFGDVEPFGFGVTAAHAEAAFERFVVEALPLFGDYQDAMAVGEPVLYHSVIAVYLNAGLLDPMRVIRRVERAYADGHAPLNAVEGFIRQVLGWREYVRGIYWHFMPDYAETNTFRADRPLPDFYWSGETDMRCLAQCIRQTQREGYAHHIQRLMVTGNFALLAGIAPKEVCAWYLSVYVDAYEWVELPNTHGMALYADHGLLASKPYAASGAYIDRMSDYCPDCRFDVRKKTGPKACPFNYLYWDFLMRNRGVLAGNTRLAMVYKTLDRMTDARRSEIQRDAVVFLNGLSVSAVDVGASRQVEGVA